MSRLKKLVSPDLQMAEKRKTGLISIDPELDLGNGKTLALYTAKIAAAISAMDTYNTLLSTVDSALDTFKAAEAVVRDWNSKMLDGVADKYGRDSLEYGQAGGVRKSERKKPRRKIDTPAL